MDPGQVPIELRRLTTFEKNFIAKIKVFQTVINLGPIGKNLPHNSRIKALKGNCIHLPMPVESTLNQINDEVGLGLPTKHIIVTKLNQDKEFLIRNLVNINHVYEALVWLKNNNPFYKNIIIPPTPDELFSYVIPTSDQNKENSSSSESVNDDGIPKAGNIPGNFDNSRMNDNSELREEESRHEDPDMINEETDPETIIKKLSSVEYQTMLEHYSIVDMGKQDYSIMDDFENYYEFLNIRTDPVGYREPNVDLLGFPWIFPFGKAGQNSTKRVQLQPKMYEKTRLLSGKSEIRRNIQYIFYLLQVFERRLINQGVYHTLKNVKCLKGKTVGQLLQMLKEGNLNIEKNLNRVISKIPNSSSYWNGPRSQLKCLCEAKGPATFFITFSPAEYDWLDLLTYLIRHNPDLAGDENIPDASLSTMDPMLTSAFIHQRFQALHKFILDSNILGKVTHWFYRIEYQSRGAPHFHCLFWIEGAPIIGKSSMKKF